MILYTLNGLKMYETRSSHPNTDWTGSAEYIIDETDNTNISLIQRIKKYTPYYEYVIEDNKLVDITPIKTETTNEEEPMSIIDQLKNDTFLYISENSTDIDTQLSELKKGQFLIVYKDE